MRFDVMDAPELPPGYVSEPQNAPTSPLRHRFLPGDEDEEALERTLTRQLSPDAERPPAYTAHNENVTAFALDFPFIYATHPSLVPRYHLFAEYSRKGKPQKLQIRRLLLTESRRLSSTTRRLSTISSSSSKSKASDSAIEYDDDTTLYIIQNETIRGRRARTLPGYVQIAREIGKCQFWHMTRNEEGDALRKENEKKILKFGYHGKDEWNKVLLYEVMRGKWKRDGEVVATEGGGGLSVLTGLEVGEREELLTCWVAKRWYDEYKRFRVVESVT